MEFQEYQINFYENFYPHSWKQFNNTLMEHCIQGICDYTVYEASEKFVGIASKA